ncbi:hypothetical protein GWK36_02590 [Caldichromatium japonicum]|uniref:Uncharacterized protein n=1 Tax=Caldichromatium japonicum TaxID=2699430 RepID=A0A6G7VAH4_9GAMM|nr:hypothetical protein [Caldichromatium japonicum]QIK37073.1 hypothetical protein GWK36_02590 [Caldichromatium japonicum]
MRSAFYILLLIPFLGSAPLVVAAQEGPPPVADPAGLTERLHDLQELLGKLESLESQLIAQGQEAQAHAEAAADYEARRRYERLATETGARLAELRATRRALADQIQHLEETLKTFRQD